ncbi:MAG: hypothetical protein ABJC89_15420 [Acidobacteriota bacterium]
MKKVVSSLLALSILALSAPAWAAGDPANPVAPLRAAVAKSASQIVLTSTQTAAAEAQSIPRTLPRTGSTRIRKQGGGGHAGMVIGLVSTLAGAAGTYYMIKELRKTTDQANQQ